MTQAPDPRGKNQPWTGSRRLHLPKRAMRRPSGNERPISWAMPATATPARILAVLAEERGTWSNTRVNAAA